MSSPVYDLGALKYETNTSSIILLFSVIWPNLIVFGSSFSLLLCINILFIIFSEFSPLILIIPIPPTPAGVEIAAIVFILISPFLY
jgi:hypothetical protein